MSLAAKHSARFGRHLVHESSMVPRSTIPGTNVDGNISLTAAIPGALIFGLIVLGIAVWRIRVYLRRRNALLATASNVTRNGDEKGTSDAHAVHHINFEHAEMEKPSKAHLADETPADTYGGWVPQIKSVSSPQPVLPITAPPGRISQPPRRQSTRQSTPPSPPPSGAIPSIPEQPKVEVNPRKVELKFPRLMVVTKTFNEVTHDDELAIEAGNVVRLLEEYEDGWCLAQMVGGKDTKKGAVPRAYLDERTSGTSF